MYLKEQTEYIQNQIDTIRDSVEDRQSRIARQTKNEYNYGNNISRIYCPPPESYIWTNHENY